MQFETYYHGCSKQYTDSISPDLYPEVMDVLSRLPKRTTQSEINKDLFWLLGSKGWSYDSKPPSVGIVPPNNLRLGNVTFKGLQENNQRDLCLTSTTLDAKWRADFAKSYDGSLVHIEVRFGKVEAMFKDFCGFRIAHHEKRLHLGIEIVMSNPTEYFKKRKAAISGMAYFEIAKTVLPSMGLDCPICLIGVYE